MPTITSSDIRDRTETGCALLEVAGRTVHHARFFPYSHVQIVFTDGTILTISETQQAGDIEVSID